MNWIALMLGLSMTACGSRTDGKPGQLEADESQRAPSCGQEGVRRCDGAVRQVCGRDGQWSVIETCESAAACEPTHCNEAACELPGTLRCTGTKWITCRDDRLWSVVDVCDDVTTCCGGV
jgi:hypothetical protein